MFTRKDIHYNLLLVAEELNMYDNITQSEIDELAQICTSPSFKALERRHNILKDRFYNTDSAKTPYYQIMRPTIVFQVVDLENHMARCRNPRVQAILRVWLKTIQDKMEYCSNYYNPMYVNLIRAFPNLSDAQLAQYCIANKLSANPDIPNDTVALTEMLGDIRANMTSPTTLGSGPITDRERLYASRWLEIFEQSPQGKNTNGKQR